MLRVEKNGCKQKKKQGLVNSSVDEGFGRNSLWWEKYSKFIDNERDSLFWYAS